MRRGPGREGEAKSQSRAASGAGRGLCRAIRAVSPVSGRWQHSAGGGCEGVPAGVNDNGVVKAAVGPLPAGGGLHGECVTVRFVAAVKSASVFLSLLIASNLLKCTLIILMRRGGGI